MATSGHLEEPGTSAHYVEPIETFLEVCQKVACCISKERKWLGRRMGFTEPELDNLSQQYHMDGPPEIIYQMMFQWRQRLGKAATLNLLAQHLQEVGRVDLSHTVLKMAKESNKPPNILPMPIVKSTGSSDGARRGKQKRKVTRSPSSSPPPTRKEGTWESIKSMLQIEHSRLEIPKMPWLEEWELDFADYYVDLTISTKHEDAIPLQLHEIFKSVSQSSCELPTRILIEGPAGYGKSTLARKLCFDHATAKNYIRHFEAVILLRLREFSGTLEEMIIERYELPNCRAELVSEFLIQNQRKILFVLDGFDELHQDNHPHVTPLLKGKQYPQSTVIVTSRMGCMKLKNEKPDSSVRNLLRCMTSRISIVGITGENRVAFLQLYLKGYSSEKCASFIKSTDEKFGLSKVMAGDNLFDCPLYLLLLVTVAEETDLATLRSKTQLYKHLFNFILRRMLAKEGQVDQTCDFFEFSAENPPAYVEMLSRFGSFAGVALEEEQYTFTEEEILRACGNDGTILKLGILTRNDSKTALRRKSWFEPIHLSFLEFASAYTIWAGCASTHPFLRSLHSINMIPLPRLLYRNPVASFVCGLCWKQLPTLLSAFTPSYSDLLEVMIWLDQAEMMAESQLELSELGKSFLPLVLVECTVGVEPSVLVKEALLHAVQTRRDQRIILEHKKCTAAEQHQGCWLKVTTGLDASGISQDWRALATSQNIEIRGDAYVIGKPGISFTLCEAPLQEQQSWLSHLMNIEGVLQNKPIHTIWYECPREKVSKLVDLMTDLIRLERVVAVRLALRSAPHAESWKEFMHCANESKELLDMTLNNQDYSSPLIVDLTPAEGKRWRKVELNGDFAVRVGSQLVRLRELNDLESFVRGMPSNIQALQLGHFLRPHVCVYRNDDLPAAHNVEELVITVNESNLSLVQWESLKNLKVLTTIDAEPDLSTQDLTTFLLSVIFHCHSLVRIQLGEGCTEQLSQTFLDRLSKEKWPTLSSDRGASAPTSLHLNTLMIPATDESVLLTSATANLVKEALQTGGIEHLWVGCSDVDVYTIIDFMELFSPAEFNMKAVDEQSWPKYNKWGTAFILEVSVN